MIITAHYDKDGVRATLARPTRATNIRAMLYMKALRDLHPESRYRGTPVVVNGKTEFQYDPFDKELADELNKTIEQFGFVIACVTELSGLPYGLPDVRDSTTIMLAYQHFLSDEGVQMYADWANLARDLQDPLTGVTEKPPEFVTSEELADPLSEVPVMSLVSS